MTALQLKNHALRLLINVNEAEKLERVIDFIESDIVELSKEEKLEKFKNNVKESLKEIKLHQEGKIELQTAEELLNEL